MAHNLATINGRVAMAYQGQTPWHKLGTRVSSITDVQTALTAGNLDWTVSKTPLYRDTLGADGQREYRIIPDKFAVVRDVDSAYLGTVGKDMTLLQNADAFGILGEACARHGVTIESVGALGNGSKTWMLAKMPVSITVPTQPVSIPGDPSELVSVDQINGYVLILNAHDGSERYSGRLTGVRAVCQNTIAMAKQDKAIVQLKHGSKIGDRAAEVGRMIERLTAALKETGETYGQLAQRRMGAEEIAEYIDQVFPAPENKVSTILEKRRQTVARLVFSGKGARLAGSDPRTGTSTAWAVYNAVTEYLDHVRPAETENAEVAQRQNLSAVFGSNWDLKIAALEQARRLVAA